MLALETQISFHVVSVVGQLKLVQRHSSAFPLSSCYFCSVTLGSSVLTNMQAAKFRRGTDLSGCIQTQKVTTGLEPLKST